MRDDIAEALRRSIDKQNELQEAANDVMRELVGALQGLAQEIADMPAVQRQREKEKRAAIKAEKGIYARGAPPKRRKV
jgi:hypothetical protein